MVETNEQPQEERRAYLLDVSLFIFDVLNPQKILRNVSEGNAILEVPSAFVTMIWSSASGDTLLQDLIYAYLIGLRDTGTLSRNSNEQIRRWATATNEELRGFSRAVLDHILNFYSQFIDGATRGDSQISSSYPIRRYEPVLPDQTNGDLLRMRDAYITELSIRSHPLYDLYFLQIYHAQFVGVAASPLLPRVFMFLGRQAVGAISRWVGETDPRAINLSTRERYRQTLGWFVNEFIADQFLDIAIDGALNLGVSFIVAGIPGINILVGVSVANIVRKVVVDSIVKSPYLRKETDVPALLWIVAAFFATCICAFAVFPRLRGNIFGVSIFATPTSTQILAFFDILTPSPSPTIQPTSIVSVEMTIPTSTIIPFIESAPVTASRSSDVGYCLYVVQPGDTLQSVMSLFLVSESGLMASDRDILLSTIETNQMIKVNASCCSVINGQGLSYTVQSGENLYRIAKKNSVSVEYLASVNNLHDPRYIRTGQMLCIPDP